MGLWKTLGSSPPAITISTTFSRLCRLERKSKFNTIELIGTINTNIKIMIFSKKGIPFLALRLGLLTTKYTNTTNVLKQKTIYPMISINGAIKGVSVSINTQRNIFISNMVTELTVPIVSMK
ncbi:hypothetical protein D3C77_585420 [compost metagenome]